MKRRLLLLFCALDHLLLALFTLGNCKPYEQISSALWGLESDGKLMGKVFRPVVDFCLAWLEPDHCRKCWSIEQRQIIIMGSMK